MSVARLLVSSILLSLFGTTFSVAHAADWQYLTVPGDTLIGIGKTYLKNPNDWPKVQAENKVSIPRQMPSNTRLRIPVALLKVTPAPVQVTAVTGNVRFKTDAGFRPLKTGDQLTGGESVLTGPRSSASYRFADGTVLTQQANGKLTFGRLASYGKTGMVSTEISLESGRLEASAGKQLAPAGGFRVRTPVAVAGLRGTDFRLNVSEDGKQMTNEVTEGAVAVLAQGKSVQVAGGYGTFAEAGKPPAKPRALLPAPELATLPGQIQRLPLQFSWSASFSQNADPSAKTTPSTTTKANAWRAQIAQDADFRKVILDDVFSTPAAQWADDLPDGDYFLRVRAIDADGLEGFASTQAFTLDARPFPPLPLSPALGERLYQLQANIGWSAVPDAQGYLLQIAPTPEFGAGLIEHRLPPVTQHQEALTEGEWHWRVASLDETGQAHLFSPHRAFLVRPLPVAPAETQAKTGQGEAHFSWGNVTGAAQYDFEVNQGEGTAVVRTQTRAPAANSPLKPGKYTWRVRGLEADNQAGDWSRNSLIIIPPAAPTHVRVDAKQTPVKLEWMGDAASYRVEVASDPAFKNIISTIESNRPQAQLGNLAAGHYVVRVTALGADNVNSLPSQPVSFTVEGFKPWWLLFLPALAL
jgi:hypothetical protein